MGPDWVDLDTSGVGGCTFCGGIRVELLNQNGGDFGGGLTCQWPPNKLPPAKLVNDTSAFKPFLGYVSSSDHVNVLIPPA